MWAQRGRPRGQTHKHDQCPLFPFIRSRFLFPLQSLFLLSPWGEASKWLNLNTAASQTHSHTLAGASASRSSLQQSHRLLSCSVTLVITYWLKIMYQPFTLRLSDGDHLHLIATERCLTWTFNGPVNWLLEDKWMCHYTDRWGVFLIWRSAVLEWFEATHSSQTNVMQLIHQLHGGTLQ